MEVQEEVDNLLMVLLVVDVLSVSINSKDKVHRPMNQVQLNKVVIHGILKELVVVAVDVVDHDEVTLKEAVVLALVEAVADVEDVVISVTEIKKKVHKNQVVGNKMLSTFINTFSSN